MTEALKNIIRDKAHELGFDTVGFAAATANPADAENLTAFLADGRSAPITGPADPCPRHQETAGKSAFMPKDETITPS